MSDLLDMSLLRLKRVRVIVEAAMESSSDEDRDDDPPTPSRRDEAGRARRRNGWKPVPHQAPEASGMFKWRHDC